jgi:hypothetical protein
MTQRSMFPEHEESKPKPKKKERRAKTAANDGVRKCFDRFHALFVKKWNRPDTPEDKQMRPMFRGGKDGKHFKDMIAAWGEETTLSLIDEFFVTTNPRVVKSDYSVGALVICAQQLLIARQHSVDSRTAANVDAAHRAMRSTTQQERHGLHGQK